MPFLDSRSFQEYHGRGGVPVSGTVDQSCVGLEGERFSAGRDSATTARLTTPTIHPFAVRGPSGVVADCGGYFPSALGSAPPRGAQAPSIASTGNLWTSAPISLSSSTRCLWAPLFAQTSGQAPCRVPVSGRLGVSWSLSF